VIAVDWGTSSLRCYRLDAQGNILESRASSHGILNVAPGQFPRVLDQQIAGWNETPIVMSGMVGSRQGWAEAPYLQTPTRLEALHEGAIRVDAPGDIRILPGIAQDAQGLLQFARSIVVEPCWLHVLLSLVGFSAVRTLAPATETAGPARPLHSA